jgi:hypothetical protein
MASVSIKTKAAKISLYSLAGSSLALSGGSPKISLIFIVSGPESKVSRWLKQQFSCT